MPNDVATVAWSPDQTMPNDIATVHQAMVTRSNDAKAHGHIVPRLNRQQKTGDGYPVKVDKMVI
jgi:hypothetical protein